MIEDLVQGMHDAQFRDKVLKAVDEFKKLTDAYMNVRGLESPHMIPILLTILAHHLLQAPDEFADQTLLSAHQLLDGLME